MKRILIASLLIPILPTVIAFGTPPPCTNQDNDHYSNPGTSSCTFQDKDCSQEHWMLR